MAVNWNILAQPLPDLVLDERRLRLYRNRLRRRARLCVAEQTPTTHLNELSFENHKVSRMQP